MQAFEWVCIAGLTLGAAGTASARDHDEQQIKLDDVPQPARERIEREAKGATIVRVEMEKKKGGRVVYEAVIKQGHDETGIVVDAKGTLLGKHSEKQERE